LRDRLGTIGPGFAFIRTRLFRPVLTLPRLARAADLDIEIIEY
jgi:hypothetical protein